MTRSPRHTRGTGRPYYYRDPWECPECGFECDVYAKLNAEMSQLMVRLSCPSCGESFSCGKHVEVRER